MEKKLYKSTDNKIFLGICGGIGEYLKIDPVIIRLIFIALVCMGYLGIVAYIISAFIIPFRPDSVEEKTRKEESTIFEDYNSKYSTDNYNEKE